MRVMITGATTPIGVALVEACLAAGDELVLAVGFDASVCELPAGPRLVYQAVQEFIASMPMTAPKMMVPMISTTMTASFCATVVALIAGRLPGFGQYSTTVP